MKNSESFLPHLYESFRREIAIGYIQHEFRKLLPLIREEFLWQSIDKQIESWHEKLTIRNFWNAVHGISMGFRLKSLVPWITSLNVKWEAKELFIDELWFGGKFGPIVSLGISESAKSLKESLFLPENRKIFEQTRKKTEEEMSKTAPRWHYPIFVVRKNDGKIRVIDGNGRLLYAILNKKETIKAVVGESIAKPSLYEHWVPTSLLVDLVFWHKRQIEDGRDTTQTIAKTIVELIRDSSAGRIEFAERAIHRNDEIHMRLFNAVAEILNNCGIRFNGI